jgi:hypothetical protein
MVETTPRKKPHEKPTGGRRGLFPFTCDRVRLRANEVSNIARKRNINQYITRYYLNIYHLKNEAW